MVSGRALGPELTFVSFLWGGTRTVNERSLTVNRKSLSMSDSIVLDEATRTPSVPDTTTRSTPWSSVFSISTKSPTVLVTGRNVNWQSSRLDGRGTVIAGSPRRSSTWISANKQNATGRYEPVVKTWVVFLPSLPPSYQKKICFLLK